MDVSSVLSLEASGVRYRDTDGTEKDLFALLSENGVNLIRVRVWNDPFDSNGNGYGGGNNNIEAAVEIGRRAAAYGLPLLVDFHYSDFWADPSKQQTPKAWEGMDIKAKAEALYTYTADCLSRLKAEGIRVSMVQLGNETNGRMCGERIWMNIVHHLMKAGSRAVREVYPDALVAVHFTNPESADTMLNYASKLAYYDLDYDVFGTSYYPYWHGTLDNLRQVLGEIAETYGKKGMVMETSYAYTLEDGDFSGNTIGEGGGYEKYWPVTVQGQSNALQDVVRTVQEAGGIGVCWWEGAWIPVGTESFEENSRLWETYGSGWASSFAGSYDPADAGKYYGGCACENQAMFDFEGRALPSLATFRLLRTGQEVEVRPDAIDDPVLTCDLAGEIVLPETVSAVMNDGSRIELPVTWEAVDTAAMKASGPAEYTVQGVAEGMPATLLIRMVNFNYLINGDFEGEDTGEWVTDNFGGTEQLYIEEKKSDSLDGTKHYHFYSAAKDQVGFRLEQTVNNLPAGTYRFDVSIMGGDAGDYESYAYIKKGGEVSAECGLQITAWNAWHEGACETEVEEGGSLTVGVYVRCGGAGAWGKIDAATLTRVR
ncbi:MAG: glycosyl hydrolase 53 family protein [Clostridia bacterium]|nr:glycosyl hydrolase 53 family protein [Clostridia bacterium]